MTERFANWLEALEYVKKTDPYRFFVEADGTVTMGQGAEYKPCAPSDVIEHANFLAEHAEAEQRYVDGVFEAAAWEDSLPGPGTDPWFYHRRKC